MRMHMPPHILGAGMRYRRQGGRLPSKGMVSLQWVRLVVTGPVAGPVRGQCRAARPPPQRRALPSAGPDGRAAARGRGAAFLPEDPVGPNDAHQRGRECGLFCSVWTGEYACHGPYRTVADFTRFDALIVRLPMPRRCGTFLLIGRAVFPQEVRTGTPDPT